MGQRCIQCRKIVCRQTRRAKSSRLSLSRTSVEFLIDKNNFFLTVRILFHSTEYMNFDSGGVVGWCDGAG